jgi:thiamine biosynthesis protein ThiI
LKKIVSLISGGFDSPIATYLMIQQNFLPVCVSFITNYEYVDNFKKKILKIAEVLSNSLGDQNLKVYLIEHNSNLKIFKEKCERKLTCILCKRFMIRIAMKIGELEGTNLIVTGDILGEQASQTLDNIYSYQSVLENHSIIRPLIGFDKLDVMKISKKIGLYEICSEKSDSCVHFPVYPETHAKLSAIKAAEKNLPLDSLIKDTLANVELCEI